MGQGLYGVKQESKTKHKEISSSTALAFSSNLSSLISSSAPKDKSAKPKSTESKSDIFTAHKQTKKRSAKELDDDGEQNHQTRDNIGSASAAELHRSKKRMEEKVRLYNAMKRGEYVGRPDGLDDRGLVDFDRKWAERDIKNQASDSEDLNSSEGEQEVDDDEVIEYLDEFGRLRKGTKKHARREERRQRIQKIAEEDAQAFAAHPQMPTNIIYGDTVQHQAFNPDRDIEEKIAELARKRDKSATPPPDSHFDATSEVRTKGTGFYHFSQDAADRKREMDELEKTRLETEKIRKQKQEEKEAKQAEVARRFQQEEKRIDDQKSKRDADEFLDKLDIYQT